MPTSFVSLCVPENPGMIPSAISGCPNLAAADCFDMIPSINCETVVVYELSAHQLEYVHNSPRAGVLLNIFEEHLDHFGTFERYKQAKLNLLRYMSEEDYAIIQESLVDEVFALAVNSMCYSRMAFEIDAERLPIKGGHNLQNACGCCSRSSRRSTPG